MSTDNGFVSRAELAAHIKGIDNRFQDVAADIAEIKWGIHDLKQRTYQNSWLGPRGHELLASGAVLCACVSILIALFLR